MNRNNKKKLNKRQLLESDKYVKHTRAKPYKREPIPPVEFEGAVEGSTREKLETLNYLLGDWDAN